MKAGVKGQSRVLIAGIGLMIALPFAVIPQSMAESVLASSLLDMERNSMRYQSMAHSYKFASKGVNNKVNYSEVEPTITNLPSTSYCKLNLYTPDDYNVSYSDVISGSTFDSKGCGGGLEYVTANYELIYPAIPFQEVKERNMNTITTKVNNSG